MVNIGNLAIGDSLTDIQMEPVSRMDLIKYSGASGDFNPIHTIDEEAEKGGLPGIIAHGMWTMGNLSKAFTPYLEEGFIQEYSVRFRGMVFINDVLTLKAELVGKEMEVMFFNVVVVNQNQKEVIKGKVSFCLYE